MPDSGDFKLELRELELNLRVATGRTDQMCGGEAINRAGGGKMKQSSQQRS